MAKVLVVYGHDIGEPLVVLALVEKTALAQYPLEEMHGRDANGSGMSDLARDSICKLGMRLGIISNDEYMPSVVADLKDTVNPPFPLTADEVLVCSWHL